MELLFSATNWKSTGAQPIRLHDHVSHKGISNIPTAVYIQQEVAHIIQIQISPKQSSQSRETEIGFLDKPVAQYQKAKPTDTCYSVPRRIIPGEEFKDFNWKSNPHNNCRAI